ncbi:uncharacterized protein PSFLO_02348 [Pseudozyma flocculosa]|uniref:Uncharacterized protein n=1 Tax=Pseudozyma flocculosa TaxID=84751 RepID=A0A5C3EZN3_9BASI|nr:uncharacterized protein PSFLO_02348 [Pseudozyma flocculosa]
MARRGSAPGIPIRSPPSLSLHLPKAGSGGPTKVPPAASHGEYGEKGGGRRRGGPNNATSHRPNYGGGLVRSTPQASTPTTQDHHASIGRSLALRDARASCQGDSVALLRSVSYRIWSGGDTVYDLVPPSGRYRTLPVNVLFKNGR